MNYLSVCSGIEAASVAWHPLGWTPVAFSEIEAFPSAVLAARWPGVPNLGDMSNFANWPDYDSINLLVGGTPCQSFSVAGLRKGLADPRGNLMLTFGAIAAKYRPRWVVWENVPGVLSSGEGRDFASFLGLLTGQRVEPPEGGWQNSGAISGISSAYGVAWRILDAQHAGVPQRRRRVFVVGHLGDWRRAAAVLFERHSMQGHHPPSRQTRERIAPTISARTKGGGGLGTDFDCDGGLIPFERPVACLDASYARLQGCSGQDANHGHSHLVTHSLRGEGFDASEDGTGRGTPLVPVAYQTSGNCGAWETGEQVAALTTGTDPAVSRARSLQSSRYAGPSSGTAVRRLLPSECEFLQGFPRNYTLITVRGKPAADGPRYKALGNSMAVPCMRWIGQRIQAVDALE